MRNPHHLPKEIFSAISEACEMGWDYSFSKGNHIKLKHPLGGCVIVSVSPRTTSHIYQKIMADIKREGKKWQHPTIQRKS
jgi:predicted RNA binding protein YcfA (HicA-like mRNA interferase family)